MKRITLSTIAVACLALTVSASALAQASKPIKVNGSTVPAGLADLLAQEQIARGAPNSDQLKAEIREHLIQREALLQEAKKAGQDKDPKTKLRMDLARDAQLISSYLDSWAKKNPVTDAQARAEYDKAVKDAGDMEYKVSHIQADTEADAQAIIKKLQGGAKFADLAKDSKDAGTKDAGGDLGWVREGNFVEAPEFAPALAKLQKGKFTPQPVKSPTGFHVLLLEDSRKATNPSFEELKPRIVESLQQQAVQKHMADVVKRAKVE